MTVSGASEKLAEIHGGRPEFWHSLEAHWPEFASAYAELAAVPLRRGVLTDKSRELVLIAVNSAVTHLHEGAVRHHIAAALRHGATAHEIVEVLQLVSVLGIHAISLGFPALQDVAAQSGRGAELPPAEMDEGQRDLKERFRRTRGYWNPFWEQALRLDPALFEAYFNFSSVPWNTGVLEPKVKEFVYVAIDASTTHMFDDGTRGHMANAFNQGATVQELLEVLELCVPIGIQSVMAGLPILEEELAKLGRRLETSE